MIELLLIWSQFSNDLFFGGTAMNLTPSSSPEPAGWAGGSVVVLTPTKVDHPEEWTAQLGTVQGYTGLGETAYFLT